ncbi:PLDc N-terminal domain-containing protein [Streptomyces spinosirectus]|uniref:SHOCT domain-containing protein n=1 Tax=Streptomyces TaxID=1883 RepID=UPI000D39044B|nr:MULTISPECIES: SHOCT domain-containing protein [Streptomyces]MBY8339697.1 PLDc N-terminal domain-containing protein [Streptomyces plumbidurans]PTM87030.1 phospholipase D-like protein [Streptomyces sp. VMFN-G11Ma]UIR15769.1 PLDc N-terminal domain-containing protein [Streptomyces spinosirectus]
MSAPTYLAYDYPMLSIFWSMLVFFLWIMWFVLLFRIVVDIFRDDAMSGWAKGGWLAFVIILPFLGVFVYVIARGKNMGRREVAQARDQQRAFDSYVRETAKGAGAPSSAEELVKLSDIRARGDITDEEFARAKELVLSGHGAGSRSGATAAAGH